MTDPAEIGLRALRWLTSRIDWFDPGVWTDFLRHPTAPYAPLLELLELHRILDARRLDQPEQRDAVTELGRRLRALSRRCSATWGPGSAWSARISPDAEDSTGGRYRRWFESRLVAELDDADVGRTPAVLASLDDLDDLDDLDEPVGTRVSAMRRLEQLHMASSLGRSIPGEDRLRALTEWWSAQRRDRRLRSADCYALTHALFFATDFGLVPLRIPTADLMLHVLQVMTDAALASGHLDLVSELVLAHAIASGSAAADTDAASPCVTASWSAIADHQLADGAVPGPLFDRATWFDRAQWTGRSGRGRNGYLVATGYHTTLTATLAALRPARCGTKSSV